MVSRLPASNQAYRFMHVGALQDERARWEKAESEGEGDESGPLATLNMYRCKEKTGRNGVLQGVLRAMARQAGSGKRLASDDEDEGVGRKKVKGG
ncbi:hypothetical protein BOTBODRAFT_38609 [Botryobasidium botryosum FD-172 SS1]|uniref:Uncharacterized protein n=1 Tax=Botryobasidium botryosum (strain FD-172 SS1) TaxID=930990 RepID=A0A067M7Z8_BOTB1|nr:hypothetical protein BOTBODRAFT_38609 [Botryobasidium botryosum FD-172 SS1]